jgi:Fe2+ transport system protein FeoA
MSEQQTAYPLQPQAQPLAAFTPGQGAVITGFTGGRKLQERMAALGLFPGQRLTICQNNGDSVVVKLNGHRLALGRGVSRKILALAAGRVCQQPEACPCPRAGFKDSE